MTSQTHQLLQLFLLQTTKMIEVAMTSGAWRTSSVAWRQEDARSIHCNVVLFNKTCFLSSFTRGEIIGICKIISNANF